MGALSRAAQRPARSSAQVRQSLRPRPLGELPAVELPDEGKRLHHAQLYYKPFQQLLRVVFVLEADADPADD